jgi:hypothetical protein
MDTSGENMGRKWLKTASIPEVTTVVPITIVV